MAQTFWTGSSLSFTNGSKIVTVNTGPSVDSIYPNSKLKSGNYNEPVEVKAAYGSTIELYENWPGSTANTSATITPSSAAAAAAGVAAQQVVTEIQNLVGSASATPTANSFVKRDSNGRIKSATPSANDDVVTKGFIGSAATKNIGSTAGNVMEVGFLGWGNDRTLDLPPNNSLDSVRKAGMYRVQNDTVGVIDLGGADVAVVMHYVRLGGEGVQRHFQEYMTNDGDKRYFRNMLTDGSWSEWFNYYHSGNTNFNKFGQSADNDYIAQGVAEAGNVAKFTLPLNMITAPSSVTLEGSFDIFGAGSSQLLVEGVTSLTLNGKSSNKVALLYYNHGSNIFTGGEYLEIRTSSINSNLTING